jgi:outer membrane protein assembly factor BamD (BamD/ComL family)
MNCLANARVSGTVSAGVGGRRGVARLLRLGCAVAAAASAALACGWLSTTEHSVRFNWAAEREFTRLPPLPKLIDSVTGRHIDLGLEMAGKDYPDDESKEKARQRRADEIAAAWARADEAERRGDFEQERQSLQLYLKLTAVKYDVVSRVGDRNSAFDRLDALTALRQGARGEAVRAYLAARREYDKPACTDSERTYPDPEHKSGLLPATKGVSELLNAVPGDARLGDNVAYLRAALLYEDRQDDAAIRAFESLAAKYPQSEKREAALFMAGLINLKRSRAYKTTTGDDGKRETDAASGEGGRALAAEREARCDAAYYAARAAFSRVLREYPRGRLAEDARGWKAYLHLRRGERAEAMAEYYRMLGGPDANARVEAAVSLSHVRNHADVAEMLRVEEAIADEPTAAMAYAYHSLYNYAANPACERCWVKYEDYQNYEYEIELNRKIERGLAQSEVARVAAFAARLLRRHPRTPVGGGFALRLAQAHLEGGNNRDAAAMARRALSAGVSGDEREQALLALAFAEQRTRDFAAARKTLKTLCAEFPQGKLSEEAGRLLAMVSEDLGDFEAALEQYLAMGYEMDAAYFVDVLLTPEQLAAFINRRPNSERRDWLLYALGLRLMRESRWAEARAALAAVRAVNCAAEGHHTYSGEGRESENPKRLESEGAGVCRTWVLRDLKAIDELEWRSWAVETAEGDEAKAEALYQLASFQYESSVLTFYNAAAWENGGRGALLYGEGIRRLPDEQAVLRRHMEQVTPTARALAIYLEVARRYPQTKAARDALYTAAVCHERLADYNPYWRDAYHFGLHAGGRMVTYRDVKAAYPQYQLPRGTDGWEPVRRTVNGGPGWHAPPKRVPRPRLAERVRLRLAAGVRQANESMTNAGEAAWAGYVRPGLLTLLAVAGVLGLWYAVVITAHFAGRRDDRLKAEMSVLAAREGDVPELADVESRVERIINDGSPPP